MRTSQNTIYLTRPSSNKKNITKKNTLAQKKKIFRFAQKFVQYDKKNKSKNAKYIASKMVRPLDCFLNVFFFYIRTVSRLLYIHPWVQLGASVTRSILKIRNSLRSITIASVAHGVSVRGTRSGSRYPFNSRSRSARGYCEIN